MKSLGSIRRAFAPWNDPSAKPYIVFENVTKDFGDFTAVDDLSLAIYETRVLRAARRVGLRQVDAAAGCSPASTSRRRAASCSTARICAASRPTGGRST